MSDPALAVAGLGLGGSGGFPDGALVAEAWNELWSRAEAQRLLGLFDAAIAAGFPVTPEQATQVRRGAEAQAIDTIALDTILVRLSADLERRGFEVRVLKGPVVGRRWYPRVEWRPYGDLDLLVPPGQWDAVAAYLVERGCHRRFDEPRPGFTARFGKGACFVTPSNYEIDLHRTFVAGPHGVMFDPAVLFARPEPVSVGGHVVQGLPTEFAAVHAAMHAVLGTAVPRLLALRDVIQITRAGVGADVVIDSAARIGARWPLALATSTALETLGLEPSSDLDHWACRYRPSEREIHRTAVYRQAHRRYSLQALAAVRAVPGWRSRMAYATALAFPQRSYLERREGSRWRRVAASARLSRRRGTAL